MTRRPRSDITTPPAGDQTIARDRLIDAMSGTSWRPARNQRGKRLVTPMTPDDIDIGALTQAIVEGGGGRSH